MTKDYTLLNISLASLPCLSMPTLFKHDYSTRLKSRKHVKMSANDNDISNNFYKYFLYNIY